jgi:hypothetical protein
VYLRAPGRLPKHTRRDSHYQASRDTTAPHRRRTAPDRTLPATSSPRRAGSHAPQPRLLSSYYTPPLPALCQQPTTVGRRRLWCSGAASEQASSSPRGTRGRGATRRASRGRAAAPPRPPPRAPCCNVLRSCVRAAGPAGLLARSSPRSLCSKRAVVCSRRRHAAKQRPASLPFPLTHCLPASSGLLALPFAWKAARPGGWAAGSSYQGAWCYTWHKPQPVHNYIASRCRPDTA